MLDVHYLDTIFDVWELALSVNAPSEVKKVRMFIDFEENEYSGEGMLLIGTVKMAIELNTGGFCLEKMSVPEVFTDKESKKEAMEKIIFQIKEFLESEMSNKEYEFTWEHIDFEKQDWKNNNCC